MCIYTYKMNISRQDKIKAIGLKGKYTKIHLPDNILNNIYQTSMGYKWKYYNEI